MAAPQTMSVPTQKQDKAPISTSSRKAVDLGGTMESPKAIHLDLPPSSEVLRHGRYPEGDMEDSRQSTRSIELADPCPGGPMRVVDEAERTRLIEQLSNLIRSPRIPAATRAAGLTVIGWLARRMPGEVPHDLGVAEARASEKRMRAAPRSEE